jgi:sugar porter (SP) family MFS transporter
MSSDIKTHADHALICRHDVHASNPEESQDDDHPDFQVYRPIGSATYSDGPNVTQKHRRHSRPSLSFRNSHRIKSRHRMSRLESRIHEEHSKALIPSPVLYVTVTISLIGSFQLGWLMSELNFRPFNSDCSVNPIPDGSCVMFPGHSSTEWTMAVSSWIVGGALGALASGVPADKYGRKKTLFVVAIVMIMGALIQCISSNIYTFSLGRMISGIASGAAINVSNILIGEISPNQMRGMFTTGLQVGVATGSLAVTTVHYFVGTTFGWRILAGFPILLGIGQILLIPRMTSSPVWLIAQGDRELATIELRRLYRPCNVAAIVQALVNAHEEELHETKHLNAWSCLFSMKYRKQLIIAIVLCSAQQLSGINAIMYYSSSIFYSAGVQDPRLGNTIINVVRAVHILAAAYIMDKFKRRTLLCCGMSLMAIASIGLVFSLIYVIPSLSLLCTSVYVAAFALSIGPMAWMVSAEIFPDYLHGVAGSVGIMCTWISNFLVGVCYPFLSASNVLGSYAFTIFTGLLLFFIGFTYFVVPETAHKTFHEIQREFDPMHPIHGDEEEDIIDPWTFHQDRK